MPKKMKCLSLFKNTTNNIVTRSLPSSCHQQPRTLSFNAYANNNGSNNMFKTVNSAYNMGTTTMEEHHVVMNIEETPESLFTDQSHDCASFSTNSEDGSRNGGGVDSVERLIRELNSEDRLFFDPNEKSSNIFESKDSNFVPTFKDGVVVAMDSQDPLLDRLFFDPSEKSSNIFEAKDSNFLVPSFMDSLVVAMDSQDPLLDFKRSMEEMVEAHGVKDWEGLEELLCWYLKVNGKNNHGFIIGAFVDLIVELAFASSNNPLKSLCVDSCIEGGDSTPCSSLVLRKVKEEITQEEEEAPSSSSNA